MLVTVTSSRSSERPDEDWGVELKNVKLVGTNSAKCAAYLLNCTTSRSRALRPTLHQGPHCPLAIADSL